MERGVRLLDWPGMEMSLVYAGAAPSTHTQHGSPSSRPLDCPSPSVSALHSAVVHTYPAARKAKRKGDSPACPVLKPLTAPFGTFTWYCERPTAAAYRAIIMAAAAQARPAGE